MGKRPKRGLTKKVLPLLTALLIILIWTPWVDASGEIFLTIMHTNDEHSSLVPRGPAVDYDPEQPDQTVGGIARLATAVKNIRSDKEARGESVLLFSGGDFIGGAPYAWLTLEGLTPEISLKRYLGYDAVVIGNHEFDYGPEILAEYLQKAGYPGASRFLGVLGSNIRPPEDHPLANVGIEETRILETENGLRVGLMGLIGKDAISVATNIGEVEFTEQHETARRLVAELQEEGVDLIIALSHSGVEEEKALAADVPGIDVIVGGHCHTALYEPERQGDTLIVQAGSLLSYLGVLELAYNLETGEIRVRNEETGQPYLVKIDDETPPDSVISAAMEYYTDQLNLVVERVTGGNFDDVFAPVAYSEHEIPRRPRMAEAPFGNYLTDAMRLVAEEATGKRVDFAFQANGNIRGGIIPGRSELMKGMISFYDLAKLSSLGMGEDLGPGYPLASFYLTGKEVRRVLEVSAFLSEYMGDTYFLQTSGLRYEYVPDRALVMTVPFLDIPVPTTRAVVSAERYTGQGRQTDRDEDYEPLDRDDETLYHMVTDLYLLTFLPMVGDLLPQLELVIKDERGEPVENIQDTVIYLEGGELKTWQALVEYAASHPENEMGLPEIPPYYSATAARIVPVWRLPVLSYPLILVGGLIILIAVFRLRRKRMRTRVNLVDRV